LQELRKRLEENHVGCAEALAKKAAADKPNVMQTMMLLQQARFRAKAAQDRAKTTQEQAKAANMVAEKDNDAAQKEVQELQRVMEPKRARTNATTANDHEECDEQSSGDMDIADYRREAARIQKRRSVALGSREDVPTPQKGQAGPLEHPRLGLVGCVNPEAAIPRMTCWRSSLKNGTPRSKTKGFGRGWRRLTMLHTSNRKKISCFGLNAPASTKNLSRWCG
jgi:hypothetical protein